MNDIHRLAHQVLEGAGPDEQVEVYVGRSRSNTVRAYGGEVESVRSGTSVGVGVRVVLDGRQGFASAGALDADIAAETLVEARQNAELAEPDEWVGLAAPDGVSMPDLTLLDPELTRLTDDQRIRLACDIESAAVGLDPRITGVRTAIFSDGWGEAAIVSTEGIDVWSDGGSCSVSVAPLAVEGEETQIGSGADAARRPSDLDVEKAAAEGVDRVLSMLGGVKPASARVTAVFDPRVVASLMGIVAGTLSGDRVNRGRSPFADRVGDAIAASGLTLFDDPTDPSSLSADVHDGEGLATRLNRLIEGGVLKGFLHHTASARRAGTTSTASAVRGSRSTPAVGAQSLHIAPGDTSTQALYELAEGGVLIESVNGLHSGVNAISGDVSVGVQGHAIRGGALAEPIREATIATTLQRLLLDIVAIGGEVERLPGGMDSVPMAVSGISLSGT